ncbi:DUF6153 family protein [Spirillospora sp. CA-128828]|uniref:DUF6153 family protein n=1 Tax=Spirillospora sp. CA-128828 TaxID=3240033 RepID=UPI003D8D3919
MGGLKQVPERCPRRGFSKLPSGLLLLFCVLAMHGFQASPSPTEMTGVPLTSMSAGHHDPAPTAAANHRAAGDDQPGGDHHNDHPGGGICLAILTMLLLVMTAVALSGLKPTAVVVQILTRTRILLVGRPPPRPSLHRLSVLRL